jgi:hypothetical protein
LPFWCGRRGISAEVDRLRAEALATYGRTHPVVTGLHKMLAGLEELRDARVALAKVLAANDPILRHLDQLGAQAYAWLRHIEIVPDSPNPRF